MKGFNSEKTKKHPSNWKKINSAQCGEDPSLDAGAISPSGEARTDLQ